MKEQIDIAAPPEVVWEYLKSPAAMAEWNANVRDAGDAPFVLGRTYEVSYLMTGEKRAAVGVVERCDPPVRQVPGTLVLKLRTRHGEKDQSVVETYSLTPKDGGTRLAMHIDLSGAGIPWWARGLIAVFQTFGTRAGKPFFETLKELAEMDAKTR